MDLVQDTVVAFEDKNIQRHSYAVAWTEKENTEDGNTSDYYGNDEEIPAAFSASLFTVPGIIGWLTGMQRNPT